MSSVGHDTWHTHTHTHAHHNTRPTAHRPQNRHTTHTVLSPHNTTQQTEAKLSHTAQSTQPAAHTAHSARITADNTQSTQRCLPHTTQNTQRTAHSTRIIAQHNSTQNTAQSTIQRSLTVNSFKFKYQATLRPPIVMPYSCVKVKRHESNFDGRLFMLIGIENTTPYGRGRFITFLGVSMLFLRLNYLKRII